MRVVHLASQHPPDDVRIFLKECRSLAKAGHEVHLVAPDARDEIKDGVVLHGFALPDGYRPLRIARRLWRVWRAARNVRADICHFHEPVLVLVALLCKFRGARVVYDVHELHLSTLEYAPRRSRAKELGLRVLAAVARRSSDAFVTAWPAITRQFPPTRTVEVLNYPLTEEFPDGTRAAGGSDVIYVGIITRARGLMEMIEAAGRLRSPEGRLVLMGRFESSELEQQARALPGWARVEYVGWLDRRDVADRLGTARAGIVLFHRLGNHMEALPNKLFEYMAAGLPVIASDFPYWRELLGPLGCALFVDPLDAAQIAAAMDELISDEVRAREMGERGAVAVREGLNWEHEAAKLVGLYERLEQRR